MSLEIDFRNSVINNIDKFIKDKNISKKIEESIFKFTNDYTEQQGTPFLFESIYENKLNEILQNMDETSENKTLLENKNFRLDEFSFENKDLPNNHFIKNKKMLVLPSILNNYNIDGYFAVYLEKIK